MQRLAAACAGIAMLAGPALADPPDKGILAMLDQFMITRSVAAHCGRGDAVSTASFQSRYRRVTEQAMTALRTLASDLTQDRIEKVMDDHYSEIDRRVVAIVAQESCEGSHIREALQKYDCVAGRPDTPLMADKNNR